jgi:hypothetical protein
METRVDRTHLYSLVTDVIIELIAADALTFTSAVLILASELTGRAGRMMSRTASTREGGLDILDTWCLASQQIAECPFVTRACIVLTHCGLKLEVCGIWCAENYLELWDSGESIW